MKRQAILVLVMVVLLAEGASGGTYSGGDGSEGNPYRIATPNDLNDINNHPEDFDKHFVLVNDINLAGYTYTRALIAPDVNNNEYWFQGIKFTGVFDGNDHNVSNFTYDCNNKHYIGLFGYVDGPNAEIRDLGLVDPNIIAGTANYVGSLVGLIFNGRISGCYVHGCSVSGRAVVGGLAGYSNAAISNCHAVGMIDVSGQQAGGLVGLNVGNISKCYSISVVTGDGHVGALVGSNFGHGLTITYCYSTGSVAGERAGGLVGSNRSGISNCYSTASVTGVGYSAGGLAGINLGGEISKCYSSNSVVGNNKVGGLVGRNSDIGKISNCFTDSSVLGNDQVGGLVGGHHNGTITPTPSRIYNCYSIGSVSGTTNVGGLVGYNYQSSVGKSFWDTETSGQASSAGGTGLPTVEMQMESTFTDVWWDFVGETANGTDDVWVIRNGLDYPKLAWTGYYGGHGTQENPYEIWTAEQMQEIGANPNDWDANFVLEADINLAEYTGTQFNIIGNSTTKFTGIFDGNGHTIYNFTYDSTGVNYIGLFGRVGVWGDGGEIQDLGLTEPNIDAGTSYCYCVGALVGSLSYGSVRNCYIERGSVSGVRSVGGLVGTSGSLDNTITNCYATCSVWGDEGVGGLIGGNNSNIRNCYSIGSVSGNTEVGGFVGSNIAGVAGAASIYNCYARGSVLGDNVVGGLVGRNIQSAMIRKCYSTGSVWGNSNVGGLVGINDNFAPDSFWDIESSDCNSSDGGVGKTTAEMQTKSTYTDVGWDFVGEVINGANDVWTINEGASYPEHVWPKVNFVGWYEVDFADWAVFSSRWFDSCPVELAGSDISKDGIVDIKDFCLLAGYWRHCGYQGFLSACRLLV
jgi:hypothetical protein